MDRPEIATINIQITRFPNASGIDLPHYASIGAAGMDLRAAIQNPVKLPILGRALIPTGIGIALPMGVEAQIRPRSGLAHKHGVTVLNTPGTIDSDYRGEISVILINLGQEPFTIERGDRIAQMVIASYLHGNLNEVNTLSSTVRGTGGFGSTGTV